MLEQLQEEIATNNAYAELFKQMHEILCEEEMRAAAADTTPRVVTLRFSSETARDARRYNTPTVDEVAAIFVGEDGAPPANRDIVIYPREAACRRVSETSKHVDPMS